MDAEQPRLRVKAFSPYEVYFEGTAVSVSAANTTGPFDVLPGHTNFFTVLKSGRVTVDTGYSPVLIEIESGIMQVRDNALTLFANV